MKEHVIINLDRTVNVPESIKKIGIQYDHNVKTIAFDCPRYPDENQSVDMSTMKIFINWMLPDKTLGSTIATNVCVDSENENLMHFDWVITKAVTSVSGVLSTLICIKETTETGEETYHWNSELIQSFKVGNGMECTEEIVEQNIDVITQLLVQMDAVNTRTSEEALERHVENYLTENPPTFSDQKVSEYVGDYMEENAQTHVDNYLKRNPLTLDETLTDPTKAAPADSVGELKKEKVTMPVDAGGTVQNGISGQILRSNGDGTTQWASAFPFDVEILETICENVELTPDNNTYSLPSEITLNLLDLYYIDYKTFREGVIDDLISGVYFSRVTGEDENYVDWLSDGIILESTRITDNLMQDSSILSIYKVSLNVSDGVLDVARKLEGFLTTASGDSSHAEGSKTIASGKYSHAEGYETIASGIYSHAEGRETIASGDSSHAEGRCNIEDTEGKYAHIVGNGNAWNNRSNAHTLDWDGNAWFAGDVFVGGSSQDDGVKLLKTGEAIPIPQTASVGQVLVINSVDENGKPTEWKPTKFDDIPTDDHINELIRTALNKIGVAEEGAY